MKIADIVDLFGFIEWNILLYFFALSLSLSMAINLFYALYFPLTLGVTLIIGFVSGAIGYIVTCEIFE